MLRFIAMCSSYIKLSCALLLLLYIMYINYVQTTGKTVKLFLNKRYRYRADIILYITALDATP